MDKDLTELPDESLARGLWLGNLLCRLLAKQDDELSQTTLHELQKQRLAIIQEQRRRGYGPPDVTVEMKPVELFAQAKGV